MKARGLRVKTGAVFEPPQPEWLVATDPAYLTDSDGKFLVSGTVYGGDGAACTITLTGDGLDSFGLAPMAVSGQTVSVTGDGSSIYGMWTGAAGVPVNWTGVRVVELGGLAMTGGTGQGLHQVARAADIDNVSTYWQASTSNWTVTHSSAAGSNYGSITLSGTISDHFAIGIDGDTGDAIVYQNGSPVVTSATTAGIGTFAGLAGMFSGDSAIIVNQARLLGNGDTYSAEIITQSDKYNQTYPAGTLDWCGNPLS